MNVHDFRNYSGDVNLEYGGFFADLSDLRYGDANVLRITDLDSGAGFTGAVLVEQLTVCDLDNPKRVKEALACCGWDAEDVTLETAPMQMIDAFILYGYYDPDQGIPPVIVQCDPEGPEDHDGWRKQVPTFFRLAESEDLLDWLSGTGYLRDFE
jgi:hypothetical protein